MYIGPRFLNLYKQFQSFKVNIVWVFFIYIMQHFTSIEKDILKALGFNVDVFASVKGNGHSFYCVYQNHFLEPINT